MFEKKNFLLFRKKSGQDRVHIYSFSLAEFFSSKKRMAAKKHFYFQAISQNDQFFYLFLLFFLYRMELASGLIMRCLKPAHDTDM